MTNLLKQILSQALYSKRLNLQLSQEIMAEKCCISRRQYVDLEHGLRLPSLQTFINISIIMDFDLNGFCDLLRQQGYSTDDKNGVA